MLFLSHLSNVLLYEMLQEIQNGKNFLNRRLVNTLLQQETNKNTIFVLLGSSI
jgi:hypothetical protein